MSALPPDSMEFTLPCVGCGACVPFALGPGASLALVCPRCGANIHLQDRTVSVERAMLSGGAPKTSARSLRRRLRRLA